MRVLCLGVLVAFSASTALAADIKLSPADTAAAFKAAGFAKKGNRWEGCGDPGTAAYTPGAIDLVRDLNGDGQPEAVISEGSSYCFGNTGMGYAIVSKQAAGWKLMNGGPGIPTLLTTKGAGGWPDIEIGGPGFCFPVERWNGKEYRLHRYQYEGKACRPR